MVAKYKVHENCGKVTNEKPMEGRKRWYYIAAVEEIWDYTPSGKDMIEGLDLENSTWVVARRNEFAKTLRIQIKIKFTGYSPNTLPHSNDDLSIDFQRFFYSSFCLFSFSSVLEVNPGCSRFKSRATKPVNYVTLISPGLPITIKCTPFWDAITWRWNMSILKNEYPTVLAGFKFLHFDLNCLHVCAIASCIFVYDDVF